MRRRLTNYTDINTVLYRSNNATLIGILRRRNTKIAVIIGDGCSLNLCDGNNDPKLWDECLLLPDEKEYEDVLNGDIMHMYFSFTCNDLDSAGKEIAEYINSCMYKYDNIFVVGHSVAGVCFANMARYLKRNVTFHFISVPFLGTTVARNEICWENSLSQLEHIFYSDNCRMYSMSLLDDFLKKADFSGIKNHESINVIAECKKLYKASDYFGKKFNKKFNLNHGDGIVKVSSQRGISTIYEESVNEVYIDATHWNSLQRYLSVKRYRYII